MKTTNIQLFTYVKKSDGTFVRRFCALAEVVALIRQKQAKKEKNYDAQPTEKTEY